MTISQWAICKEHADIRLNLVRFWFEMASQAKKFSKDNDKTTQNNVQSFVSAVNDKKCEKTSNFFQIFRQTISYLKFSQKTFNFPQNSPQQK